MSNATILAEYPGHLITRGSCAGQIRNNYRLVEVNNDKFYEMDTHNGSSFYFDLESLPDVLHVRNSTMDFKPTWYQTKVGYIGCHIPKKSTLYLHAWIKKHVDNGRGQDSVDHINRNKLDNRVNNLRIVSQSEQNRNRGKKERPKNARPLPNELCGIQLPIHVTWNREKKKTKKGESYLYFFRIESTHPKLISSIKLTKKQDMSVLEKYKIAKEKLYELNHENINIVLDEDTKCFNCNIKITSDKDCKVLDELVCDNFYMQNCLKNKLVCNDCFDKCSNKLICKNCKSKRCKKCLDNDENYLCGHCKNLLTTCENCAEKNSLDDLNYCKICDCIYCNNCSDDFYCNCDDSNKIKLINKFIINIDA